MTENVPDILASRLDIEVIVFRGHTRREMILIGLISLAVSILGLGILAKLCLGMFLVGLGLSFPLAIPIGWGVATLMQAFKAGKPRGYLKQQFLLCLDQQGIHSSPYIQRSGYWSVRRIFP